MEVVMEVENQVFKGIVPAVKTFRAIQPSA